MNQPDKKEQSDLTPKSNTENSPQKYLTPSELAKLTPEEQSNYFGQAIIENLNNPLNHDKST